MVRTRSALRAFQRRSFPAAARARAPSRFRAATASLRAENAAASVSSLLRVSATAPLRSACAASCQASNTRAVVARRLRAATLPSEAASRRRLWRTLLHSCSARRLTPRRSAVSTAHSLLRFALRASAAAEKSVSARDRTWRCLALVMSVVARSALDSLANLRHRRRYAQNCSSALRLAMSISEPFRVLCREGRWS